MTAVNQTALGNLTVTIRGTATLCITLLNVQTVMMDGWELTAALSVSMELQMRMEPSVTVPKLVSMVLDVTLNVLVMVYVIHKAQVNVSVIHFQAGMVHTAKFQDVQEVQTQMLNAVHEETVILRNMNVIVMLAG